MFNAPFDIESVPIAEARTDPLLPGSAPKPARRRRENVAGLGEPDEPVPPLLVLRSTNQMIDGMRRLLATRRRGRATMVVRYFDGDEQSAFLLAVSANAGHGLPLSLNDGNAITG
jgi:hypothetical protein